MTAPTVSLFSAANVLGGLYGSALHDPLLDYDDPTVPTLVVGEEYELGGADLDTVKSITLGGVACPFVIKAAASLRFTVPRHGFGQHDLYPLLVHDAVGAGPEYFCHLLMPSDWQTPKVKAWSELIGYWSEARYGTTDPAAHDSAAHAPFNAFGLYPYDVWETDDGVHAKTYFNFDGIDIDAVIRNFVGAALPPVLPKAADGPHGTVWVQAERRGGVPSGPMRLTFGVSVRSHLIARARFGDPTPTQSSMEAGIGTDALDQGGYALLVGASSLTPSLSGNLPNLNPATWAGLPSAWPGTLGSLTQIASCSAGSRVYSAPGPAAVYTNSSSFPTAAIDAVAHGAVVTVDLDYGTAPHILGVILTPEVWVGGAGISTSDTDPFAFDATTKVVEVLRENSSFLVEYTPPRYRWLSPWRSAVPTRQHPRDDAIGSAPRQAAASTSRQASPRQGMNGTYS